MQGELAMEVIEVQWEATSIGAADPYLWRTKVPGGWLVVIHFSIRPSCNAVSPFFYPDPEHQWDENSLA